MFLTGRKIIFLIIKTVLMSEPKETTEHDTEHTPTETEIKIVVPENLNPVDPAEVTPDVSESDTDAHRLSTLKEEIDLEEVERRVKELDEEESKKVERATAVETKTEVKTEVKVDHDGDGDSDIKTTTMVTTEVTIEIDPTTQEDLPLPNPNIRMYELAYEKFKRIAATRGHDLGAMLVLVGIALQIVQKMKRGKDFLENHEKKAIVTKMIKAWINESPNFTEKDKEYLVQVWVPTMLGPAIDSLCELDVNKTTAKCMDGCMSWLGCVKTPKRRPHPDLERDDEDHDDHHHHHHHHHH
jgi:hypothetical protein